MTTTTTTASVRCVSSFVSQGLIRTVTYEIDGDMIDVVMSHMAQTWDLQPFRVKTYVSRKNDQRVTDEEGRYYAKILREKYPLSGLLCECEPM